MRLICQSLATKCANVVCSLEAFDDVLPTGYLALLWSFAESIGYLQPFKDGLHVNMKEVMYSNFDRVKTLMTSIAAGCHYGKDINHKLRPYQGAARCCQLEQFPDQAQINRFLRRLELSNISELDSIFEHLLSRYGLWHSQSKVDIDFDCTGLVVYGKSYQLARKGYFPGKRSSRGYQLSLATTANAVFNEVLSLHLDPGNTHHDTRFWDAIYQVAAIVGDVDRIGVVRADSASGTGANIEALIDHKLSFLLKGHNTRTAEKFAKKLSSENWFPVDLFVRIADMHEQTISQCRYPVRVIVVETTTPKLQKKYSHLCTDLENDPDELFYHYNKRQNIESIIKEDKYGLHITNLRTRGYLGILSFLYFAMITYNLLSLFRYYVLSDTELQEMSTTELTNKLMDIPAKIKIHNNQLTLAFPQNHHLCRKFFSKNSSQI